jgi:hypothetical protein
MKCVAGGPGQITFTSKQQTRTVFVAVGRSHYSELTIRVTLPAALRAGATLLNSLRTSNGLRLNRIQNRYVFGSKARFDRYQIRAAAKPAPIRTKGRGGSASGSANIFNAIPLLLQEPT